VCAEPLRSRRGRHHLLQFPFEVGDFIGQIALPGMFQFPADPDQVFLVASERLLIDQGLLRYRSGRSLIGDPHQICRCDRTDRVGKTEQFGDLIQPLGGLEEPALLTPHDFVDVTRDLEYPISPPSDPESVGIMGCEPAATPEAESVSVACSGEKLAGLAERSLAYCPEASFISPGWACSAIPDSAAVSQTIASVMAAPTGRKASRAVPRQCD